MKKLILLSTLLIVSCGARKTSKSETTEKAKTETEIIAKETETKQSETNTNVKETKSTTIDKENNIVSEVTEITPDDKTKPALVKLPNGQIIDITNAKYRNVKTTDLSKEKTVSLSKYELVQKDLKTALKINNALIKQNKELLKQLETKDVDIKANNFWNWFILIVCLIAFIWFVIWSRRYTNKESEKLI